MHKFIKGDIVKHLTHGYLAEVADITKIRKVFEEDFDEEFQYRLIEIFKQRLSGNNFFLYKKKSVRFRIAAEKRLELIDPVVKQYIYDSAEDKKWNDESELAKYGYRIWDPMTQRPLSADKRINALEKFIKAQSTEREGVGRAVKHLIVMIDLKLMRRDRDVYTNSIQKWAGDLMYLSEQYPEFQKLFSSSIEYYKKKGYL